MGNMDHEGGVEGLGKQLEDDEVMTAHARRVAELYSRADPQKLEEAMQSGDHTVMAEALGITTEELEELVLDVQAAAMPYADRLDDLKTLSEQSREGTAEDTSSGV